MQSLAVAWEGKLGKVGDGTLEEEGEYDAGRLVLLSMVAFFFLSAVVDGAGEREQRTSWEGAESRVTATAGRMGGKERIEPLDAKVRLISSH